MSKQNDFSYGMFAITVLGTGALILILSGALVFIAQPSPQVGLVIALLGIVGAIAGMGFVSTRLLNKAAGADPKATDTAGKG